MGRGWTLTAVGDTEARLRATFITGEVQPYAIAVSVQELGVAETFFNEQFATTGLVRDLKPETIHLSN